MPKIEQVDEPRRCKVASYLTQKEFAEIRKQAEERGMSLSDWIRENFIVPKLKPEKKERS